MKLLKRSDTYLEKHQWRKIFLAMSILIFLLYSIALTCSLTGNTYFILNYQNEQMDSIENWLTTYRLLDAFNYLFSTLEFFIIASFAQKKLVKWYYILPFYTIAVFCYYVLHVGSVFFTIYPFIMHLVILIIDNFITYKKFNFKQFLSALLRFIIGFSVAYLFQIIIFAIKNGNFSIENNIFPISSAIIYALEYDIALSVVLTTVLLYAYREKGDSTVCHNHGSSSQILKKQLLKSNTKILTKTQKNKLKLLYIKFYLTQLGAFLLLMVLPFILGKVLEFLTMYLAFAVCRYILGFKYSLHFKKETICITVGVIVFGILTLAVPFFYVVMFGAIFLGAGLGILLHLSYKYKGFYLFNKIAKPDKFAELYVLMDGDLTPHHVKIICRHRRLDIEETEIINDFAEGNKKSYIAKKYNYSEKTIERKINEAIDKLNKI